MASYNFTPAGLIHHIQKQTQVIDAFHMSFINTGIQNVLAGKYSVSLLLRDYRRLDMVRPMWEIGSSDIILQDLRVRVAIAFEETIAFAISFPIKLLSEGSAAEYIFTNLETSFMSIPRVYQVQHYKTGEPVQTTLSVSLKVLHSINTATEINQFSNLFHFPLSAN